MFCKYIYINTNDQHLSPIITSNNMPNLKVSLFLYLQNMEVYIHYVLLLATVITVGTSRFKQAMYMYLCICSIYFYTDNI